MHSERSAYRDLKPENILLDHRGQLKLTDLGFAKEITDLSFTLCGTPEYIAPELVLGTGHDRGVDWWALGVFVYEMLIGNPPFYGELAQTYESIVRYKPPTQGLFDPQEDDDELEAELRMQAKSLIIELLRKDKTKRLGCLHGGTDDVKRHPFFAGIDWDRIAAGTDDAPVLPQVTPPEACTPHPPDDEGEETPDASTGTIDYTNPDSNPDAFKDF
jgi:serine/threonine protein kinase